MSPIERVNKNNNFVIKPNTVEASSDVTDNLTETEKQILKKIDQLKEVLQSDPSEIIDSLKLAKVFETENGANLSDVYKGVSTLSLQNDIHCIEIENLMEDLEYFMGVQKPFHENQVYIVFVQKNSNGDDWLSCQIVKKDKENKVIKYYDQQDKEFKELTEEEFKVLHLKEEDHLIILSKDPYTNVSPTQHHSKTEITENPLTNKFYHEMQSVNESVCGICSINNFFGKPCVKYKDYKNLSVKILLEKLKLDDSEIYKTENDYLDPFKGADPYLVMQYIKHLAESDTSFSGYKDVKLVTLSNKNGLNNKQLDAIEKRDPDRAILGLGGSHFVVMRKSSKGKYRIIDSMDPDSQEKEYGSLKECLKMAATLRKGDLTCIYV